MKLQTILGVIFALVLSTIITFGLATFAIQNAVTAFWLDFVIYLGIAAIAGIFGELFAGKLTGAKVFLYTFIGFIFTFILGLFSTLFLPFILNFLLAGTIFSFITIVLLNAAPALLTIWALSYYE